MALSIKIDNVVYPILEITEEISEGDKHSKNIVLEMSHAEAESLFVDNVEMLLINEYQVETYVDIEVPSINYDEEGNKIETTIIETQLKMENRKTETDLSDFCLAGRIIDYRDGRISVLMTKISDKELLNVLGSKASSKKELSSFIECVNNVSTIIPDNLASQFMILFPDWEVNKDYKIGDRVLYNKILYKVLQNHTSQEAWTPEASPSLFTKVLTDEVSNAILEWEQPESTNPYMIGDKVLHNDLTWVSIVDNNVWEPGIYGWETVE